MHNGTINQFVTLATVKRRFGSLVIASLLVCLIGNSIFGVQDLSAGENDTHLYFITSNGCAPCRQVEPAIEALKREGYPVTTVHFGQQQEWARSMGVDRTPTVVMITDKKMVGRHAGIIDAVTLKQWFKHQGIKAGRNFAGENGKDQKPVGTKVVLGDEALRGANQTPGAKIGFRSSQSGTGRSNKPDGFHSSTMHKGTLQAKNREERVALNATVRLKVEDPKGTSYATGTVIHTYQGESLVVTCGHVFREAQGAGEITAEYGFHQGRPRSAPGELVFYDAEARDIGLVVIRTSEDIQPVQLAEREARIGKGLDIFSVGCDNGDDPTIRRSQIKNKAAYDGSIKYDIYGRPVNGRSGGGLFTESGELIGVCNAAAVEVDEGIYTALDTIYWQIAKVNLEHLFEPAARFASAPSRTSRQNLVANASNSAPVRIRTVTPISESGKLNRRNSASADSRLARLSSTPSPIAAPVSSARLGTQRTQVSWNRGAQTRPVQDDKEVLIVVRSKSNPADTETIVIDNPTPKLLDYLGAMNQPSTRSVDVARLRMDNNRR